MKDNRVSRRQVLPMLALLPLAIGSACKDDSPEMLKTSKPSSSGMANPEAAPSSTPVSSSSAPVSPSSTPAAPVSATPAAATKKAFVLPSHNSDGEEIEWLDQDGQMAKNLRYVHDGSKADENFRIRKVGVAGKDQFCDNCSLYKKRKGESFGKCTLILKGYVYSRGWCMSWIPLS